MPLLSDIAEELEDHSIGTVGTDIFEGILPDSPDACIAVYEYGGQPVDNVSEDVEYPGLQILVRAARGALATGEAKAQSVLTTLHGQCDVTLTSTRYYYIQAQGSVAQLGFDQKGRALFVVNFIVTKEVE